MKKEIMVFCQDTGGTQNLIPVIRELKAQPFNVKVLHSGKIAHSILSKHDIASIEVSGAAGAMQFKKPDLLITAIPSSKNFAPYIVQAMKDNGVRTVALMDYLVTKHLHHWFEIEPDYAVVNDEIAKRWLRERWSCNIIVSTSPNMDLWVYPENFRKIYRNQLGLSEKERLVVFAGGGHEDQPLDDLREVRKACNEHFLHLVAVPHPKHKNNRDYVMTWRNTMGFVRLPVHSYFQMTTEGLIGAADIFVTDYSTTAITAASAGVYSLAMWYEGNYAVWEETGIELDDYPMVTRGCNRAIEDYGTLVDAFFRGKRDEDVVEQRQRQQELFTSDGKNAHRLVEKLLAL